jgi:alpha-beta hydrolase superfamily lysophospholipase
MLFVLTAANAAAYMHAWRFTHFAPSGPKTGNPEDLSFWTKARVLFTGVSVPRPGNNAVPAREFATHRFATTDGLELEAWHVPHSDPQGTVLLFHGYTGVKSELLAHAEAFHELGYDTLLVDFRGSGGSDGDETTIGYREADDVAAAVAFARDGLGAGQVFLYGQSMGAAAILRAVGPERLDVEGIVVACPFDRLTTTVEHRFDLMGAPSFPGTQLLLFWGSVQQGFWCFGHAPLEYAESVTCPTLHLQGVEDTRVTAEEARSIFEALRGEKRLVEFEGVDHLESCLQADRELWMREVGRFLADLRE